LDYRFFDVEDNEPNGAVAAEEPPAKMLDDLFKKTKATPYIYWLPLTDEQVSSIFVAEPIVV
jgi:hypothetical protein